MSVLLIVLLVLLLVGAMPTWGYSRSWGYSPVGIILLIVVLYLVFGARLF